MIKAITVLSYRISGIGLYPEFINAHPELTEYESPFLVQNREIVEFIQQYKKAHQDAETSSVVAPPDASQALVMIEQCRDVVLKIRRATRRIGVSVSLTYQKFQALIQALLITPDAASTLQSFVLRLISQYKQTSLYADTGILSLDGFWNQLSQRLGAHFLPLINDETQLQDLVRRVFPNRSDKYWLDSIRLS